MERYKYIVIDDDISTHLSVNQNFKSYSNYFCAGIFYNPLDALEYLKKNQIDLIFLDIEMPEMNGFQFLEALQQEIFVVILTAYPDRYSLGAHEFYEGNLVKYANKAQLSYLFPKIIAHFEKKCTEREIVHRIKQLYKNETHIFPKKVNNKSLYYIDIRIIKVVGHHIALKMKSGEEHIFRMSFSKLKTILPESLFFRINRNIIINIMYVTALNDTTICLEEDHFVISLNFNENIVADLRAAMQLIRPEDL